MLDLSVITVTYRSEKQIAPLINSVREGCQKITYEHIIVDNGSTDNTDSLVRSFGDSVVYLSNATNQGFSAANRSGYLQSKGKYLLFLNPDMEVSKSSLDQMVHWMDTHPKVGISGCRLVDHMGKFNEEAAPRRFPKLHEQFIILLKLQKLFPKSLDRYLYKDFDFSKEQAVDSVRGSFMMMRREFTNNVGWPFDPRYFIWFEDVDICREAWKHGFSVMYTPIVECRDAIGQSFRQRDRGWRFKQYTKSLLCYLKKWEPMYVWCWVPLIYSPIASAIGSKWFEKLKQKITIENDI